MKQAPLARGSNRLLAVLLDVMGLAPARGVERVDE